MLLLERTAVEDHGHAVHHKTTLAAVALRLTSVSLSKSDSNNLSKISFALYQVQGFCSVLPRCISNFAAASGYLPTRSPSPIWEMTIPC